MLTKEDGTGLKWGRSTTLTLISVVEPERPFLAGAVKKGAAPAPALQLKLQL